MNTHPAEIMAAIQLHLPTGFTVERATFFYAPATDKRMLEIQYTYCDRHKYIQLDAAAMPSAEEIAAQIEIDPVLDYMASIE